MRALLFLAIAAASLFESAEREDLAFDFADALEHYEAAAKAEPSAGFARRAALRAADLRAHAEGDFAPLAELERVRRDPSRASDATAIDALVAHADAFPPGLVRVEAWVLAAEAYARRLGRPGDAARLYPRIALDPKTDPVLAEKAARDLVDLDVASGDLAQAERDARLAKNPSIAAHVARLVHRRWLHATCIASVLVVLALAGRDAARRRAAAARAVKKLLPVAAGYAVYVAGAGALLAAGYESGNARPFLLLGAALFPLLLLARAWGASGSSLRWARALRAAACAAGAFAIAFLVLEHVDAAYLEGLGL